MPKLSKIMQTGKNFAMKKVNLIIQEILKCLLIFLFCFVWLQYVLKTLWLAVLVSTILTITIYALLLFINTKKHNKIGLKLKEKSQAEDIFLSLACKDNPLEFFETLLKQKYEKITKHKNFLTFEQSDEMVVLWLELCFEGLNVDKFLNIYSKIQKLSAGKIIIVCKEVSDKQLFSIIQSFKEKFVILDEYQTYQSIYKENNLYPTITHQTKVEKKMIFKDFVSYSFNKNRTKGYLLSAFVLVISSLFVKITIYYCIIASFLVIFALISQFNPVFNHKSKQNIL